jgi:KipI family sensor histidine kinase inhibitor
MMQRLGSRALRLPRPSLDAARLVAAGRSLPSVVDVVLTDAWIALYFADAAPDIAPDLVAVAAALDVPVEPPRQHDLHVRYDGEDLAAVAREVGLPVAELIALHRAPVYDVAFMGFLPGFPYLHGLDPRLHLARRATPRARVPAGAVAIGGPYAGVYPQASPGGWHLLGQLLTPQLFGNGGALLRPGDRVRFVEDP